MSKINVLVISVVLSFVLINCNDTGSTSPEAEKTVDYSNDIVEFYPVNVNNSFTYSVDTLNSVTNNYDNIGTRQVNVGNKETKDEYVNYICDENFTLSETTVKTYSKFRITKNSLDFFADTSGVYDLIPDSIGMEINIQLDEIFKIVEFPYVDNHEWIVYKGTANFGTFKFNIFSITGEYLADESLQLEELNKTVNTQKFKYHITLNIPNIANPLVSNIQEYEAYVWFSSDYGIVKLVGSALFVNPLTGNKFNHADSNKIFRHTLVSYQ